MNKMKRFLSVLSAIAVMAVGGMSVSAVGGHGLVDLDNIIFSSKVYNTNSYYKYWEFLIDKDGNINGLSASSCGLAVKMKEGCEPPNGYERVISYTTEGDEIIEEITVEEFSKYQKAMLKSHENGYFGCLHNMTNIEETDNLYYISGFRGGYKAVTEYCEKLIGSGTVEFAEPVMGAEYNVADSMDIDAIKMLNGIDIDADKFIDSRFIFSLTFEDEIQAESFDMGSVEGLEENLGAEQVIDNKIYFQFKEDIDRGDMGYMLNTLQNTETVKSVECPFYWVWESIGGYISGIPESYEQGDVNYNRKVDLLDVISICKHLLGTEKLDDMQQLLADVDGNGTVDLLDAIGVAKMLLK